MTVKTEIPDIDIQGEGKRVLSEYQPHTISIVGEGALGMNLTKVKSVNNFLETEGGVQLMAKVNKAKALDEQEAKQEAPVTSPADTDEVEAVVEQEPELDAVEADSEAPVEKSKALEKEPDSKDEDEDKPKEKAKAKSDDDEDEKVVKAKAKKELPFEKDEDEDAEDEKSDEKKPKAKAKAVEDDEDKEKEGDKKAKPKKDLDLDEDKPVEKAKSFTVDDMIEAQREALSAVADLTNRLRKALPEADAYVISDLVYSAISSVESASWKADDALWQETYDSVHQEVVSRVNKAKALDIQTNGTQEQKIKSALSLLDPSVALIIEAELATNKQKALDAEKERTQVIRAKALAKGADQYKRLATEDNSTDAITDAMMHLEVTSPEQHSVISKALDSASLILQAGNLFPDVGSSASLQVEDEGTYVNRVAKALVKESGGNEAAARAVVRNTPDYQALFGA